MAPYLKFTQLAAEMGVMGQIWISTDPNDNKYLMALSNFMGAKMDFPFQKSHSIRVATHEQGNPRQDVFRVKNGICQDYLNPGMQRSCCFVFIFHPNDFSIFILLIFLFVFCIVLY